MVIIYERKLDSSFEAVDSSVEEIVQILKEKMDSQLLFKVNFMLREILNNAVEHGNKFDTDKKVDCLILNEDDLFVFQVTDEGVGFEERENKEDVEGNVDTLLRERKRGYSTLKAMDFKVRVYGNSVRVTLKLNQEG